MYKYMYNADLITQNNDHYTKYQWPGTFRIKGDMPSSCTFEDRIRM